MHNHQIDTSYFFDSFSKNAKEYSAIILDTDGIILDFNNAFIKTFGYSKKDLTGKNFKHLFTQKAQKAGKPELELETVKSEGSADDENYLVHKDGVPIWVFGESTLTKDVEGNDYIIKVVHNLHAKKQLEKFLLESHEFIESIFDSIKDTGLIILNSTLKVEKVNAAFLKMFEITTPLIEGSRLADMGNEFWNRSDVKKTLRDVLVTNESVKGKEFENETHSGEKQVFSFDTKIIESQGSQEKKLLLVIKQLQEALKK